ncbi:MAG: type II toxin-antitoxin system VapC family toxin, partial [Candidatus Acidiferrum sp.]
MKKIPAFWDSSALVPLCTNQSTSPQAQLYYRRFSVVVWWSSVVEIRSAISRLHRNQQITDRDQQGAAARLRLLCSGWREVLPGDQLRDFAVDALGKHSLSAADALQLAAGFVWCLQRPSKRTFIT